MFNSLSARELNLIKILGLILAAAIGYYAIYLPMQSISNDAASGTDVAERIDTLNKTYALWQETSNKRKKLEQSLNNKTDNITTLIQETAASNNMQENIAYTRRTQTNIQNKYVRINTDVKINSVAISQAMKFIYDLENSNDLLFINHLNIRKGLKSKKTYDVLIKIHTFTTK